MYYSIYRTIKFTVVVDYIDWLHVFVCQAFNYFVTVIVDIIIITTILLSSLTLSSWLYPFLYFIQVSNCLLYMHVYAFQSAFRVKLIVGRVFKNHTF